MANKQQELNHRIAIELDKHCIQNEYGVLLLDQHNAIASKYKWFLNLKTASWVEVGVAVLTGCIGLIQDVKWLVYLAGTLLVVFLIFLLIRFSFRNEISKMLSKEHFEKLSEAVKEHGDYIVTLRLWFMDVGKDKKTSRLTLQTIESLFPDTARKGNTTYNELSKLFGKLQEELHEKAREKAEAKLTPLLEFYM